MLETFLEQALAHFQGDALSLWGPFVVLLICGFGMPVPEDVVLVSAGILSASVGRSWEVAAVVMYVAVVGGDSLVYCAGKYFGTRLLGTRWFRRVLSEKKQEKVRGLFDRFGTIVLFAGRFLPGLRTPIFFTAGSMRVSFWKFFLLDGTAALISAPVFVWLGHWLWVKFGEDLMEKDYLSEKMAELHGVTFWIVLVVVVFAVLAIWLKWRNARKSQKQEAADGVRRD